MKDLEIGAVVEDAAAGAREDPTVWAWREPLQVLADEPDELGVNGHGPGFAARAVLELAALPGRELHRADARAMLDRDHLDNVTRQRLRHPLGTRAAKSRGPGVGSAVTRDRGRELIGHAQSLRDRSDTAAMPGLPPGSSENEKHRQPREHPVTGCRRHQIPKGYGPPGQAGVRNGRPLASRDVCRCSRPLARTVRRFRARVLLLCSQTVTEADRQAPSAA